MIDDSKALLKRLDQAQISLVLAFSSGDVVSTSCLNYYWTLAF